MGKLSGKDYRHLLEPLELELVSMARWANHTGARILVTLLAALETRNLRRGMATLCIGGGEAVAVAVERL